MRNWKLVPVKVLQFLSMEKIIYVEHFVRSVLYSIDVWVKSKVKIVQPKNTEKTAYVRVLKNR